LPGDLPNASTLLGTNNSNGGVNNGDGNGNGTIDDYGTPGTVYPYNNEVSFFWAQLGAAGLVAGTYPAGYVRATPGVNVPASAFGNGAGWSLGSSPGVIFGSTTETYFQSYPNIFLFGAAPSGGPDQPNVVPVLTPSDSYSIDKKIDDGLPASGNVIVEGYQFLNGSYPGGVTLNCSTTNVASTAAYDLTITTPTCLMLFTNMW
jgi:hypothetical protein